MEDEAEDAQQGETEKAVPAEKRQKVELDEDAFEAKRRAKAEKRREKRQLKKEKTAKKKVKADEKKAAKQNRSLGEGQAGIQRPEQSAEDDEDVENAQMEDHAEVVDLEKFDASGLADSDNDEADERDASEASSAPSSPMVDSPAFDLATDHSAASSLSSILPPSVPEGLQQPKRSVEHPGKPTVNTDVASSIAAEPATKPANPPSGTSSPKINLPNIDQAELQERLRQRIEELRARRKADGPDGKPAKSRQELLDQRRKKDEQRKAAKKEQRRKAKEEEQRQREEQLRGSGSPLSADIFSPRSPRPQENNFSFSRLAFEDGTAADAALTGLSDPKRKKGPQDPKTALEAAQRKQSRVAGYDAEKQADIAEKDLWLNAKKRAHGERVRDDTSLLKKALKRKEKQKNKSERQWQEREQAVVKGREMKQKKRETNLQKRKDEKGMKGKKKPGAQKGGKKASRPGFEGRFKA